MRGAFAGIRRRLGQLIVDASSAVNDWRYGIDTRPRATDAHQPGLANASPYEPLSYAALHVIFREVALTPDDVFFDVGCGKGRVVCCAARQPIKKCVGIELVPPLAEVALLNTRRARGLEAPIEIRVQDAAGADYSDATVIFLYNPFRLEQVQRCLTRIGESLIAQPRRIRFVYANPVAEQAFWDCASWLTRVRTFQVPYRRRSDPSTVALWETRESLRGPVLGQR
jgi:hypothetical protein